MTSITRWMESCYSMARHESDDPRTVNAAVVISGKGVGSFNRFGVNGLTQGVMQSPEKLNSPDKYHWIEHAERAAIFAAAQDGMMLAGATLICPWACCSDCARALVGAGIKRLVRHKAAMDRKMDEHAHNKWRESIDIGDEIMRAGRVKIKEWDGKLTRPIPVLFGGELWVPPYE